MTSLWFSAITADLIGPNCDYSFHLVTFLGWWRHFSSFFKFSTHNISGLIIFLQCVLINIFGCTDQDCSWVCKEQKPSLFLQVLKEWLKHWHLIWKVICDLHCDGTVQSIRHKSWKHWPKPRVSTTIIWGGHVQRCQPSLTDSFRSITGRTTCHDFKGLSLLVS